MSRHQIAFVGVVSRYSYLSSLSEPFAHQATGKLRLHCTGQVIPVTVCSDRQKGCVPGPHVTAGFPGFSIWFLGSPGLVDWNWVITPVEVFSGPHQADPHLFPCSCKPPRESKNELVFPSIGNLYQVSSLSFTIILGLVPSHGSASCKIAKAFELLPSRRAIRWYTSWGKQYNDTKRKNRVNPHLGSCQWWLRWKDELFQELMSPSITQSVWDGKAAHGIICLHINKLKQELSGRIINSVCLVNKVGLPKNFTKLDQDLIVGWIFLMCGWIKREKVSIGMFSAVFWSHRFLPCLFYHNISHFLRFSGNNLCWINNLFWETQFYARCTVIFNCTGP